MKTLFFAEADVIKTETGEKAISFKKFVSLVTERNLFSSEKQKKFSEEIQTYVEVYQKNEQIYKIS